MSHPTPTPQPSPLDRETKQRFQVLIASGNFSWSEVKMAVDDHGEDLSYEENLTDDEIESVLQQLEVYARKLWDEKLEAEKSWPEPTDFERLDAVFVKLASSGLVALHSAGFTMSDGHQEVFAYTDDHPERQYRGYVFYHQQDVERALGDYPLYLAFGDLSSKEELHKLEIGQEITKALTLAGFEPIWDGTENKRISVKLNYQRRSPRD